MSVSGEFQRARSEVVIFDHDGDDGRGMGPSDAQPLPGNHHDIIFGNSPLHTLRPSRRRWQKCRRRGTGTPDQTNLIQRERVWECLEEHVACGGVDETHAESQRDPGPSDTGAQRELVSADDDDAVAAGGALDLMGVGRLLTPAL